MATWLIPALKAVLPHIGTIISATAPAFTKKSAETPPDETALWQKQISELQTAASQNATHVKELAEQLQHTVAAIEQTATVATTNHQRVMHFSLAALLLSGISLVAVVLHIINT